MRENFARMDLGVFVAVLLMLGMGVVLVYSSSFAVAQERFGGSDFFLERQLVRAVLAIAVFFIFVNIDYHVWGRLAPIGYALALVMLGMVLMLPDSYAVNGAKRWLGVGSFRFQVSEFACMALIVLLAQRSQDQQQEIMEWRRFFQNVIKIAIVCALIVVEPNFSTTMIVGLVGMAILFVAGSRFSHMLSLGLGLLPLAFFVMMGAGYRRNRVLSFLNSSANEKVSYQAQQALIGLGNGGLFGVGLGQGRQKLFYLPEPHTDFAFSILGEEMGFIGLLAVLAIFSFIIYRGIRIALAAPDKSGQLMAFGFTLVFATYLLMHAAVNAGLMPTTGVPMPFLSYGGMSLLFTMSSFGILLNISAQARQTPVKTIRARRERLSKFKP
jgi:cell division protein FtsW